MGQYKLAPEAIDVSDPNNLDVVKRVLTTTNTTKGTPTQTVTITQAGVDTSGACYDPGLIPQDDSGAPFEADENDVLNLTDQLWDAAGNASPQRQNSVTVPDVTGPDIPGPVNIKSA